MNEPLVNAITGVMTLAGFVVGFLVAVYCIDSRYKSDLERELKRHDGA